MSSTFNAKSPVGEVASFYASACVSRYFLITGANQGLGYESAKELARNGGIVTICSRNTLNGQKAIEKIKEEIPNANLGC